MSKTFSKTRSLLRSDERLLAPRYQESGYSPGLQVVAKQYKSAEKLLHRYQDKSMKKYK